MGRLWILVALPVALGAAPAARAAPIDVPRLSYAARVTPSGLLVASERLAVVGPDVRALELRIPVGAAGLVRLDVRVGTALYEELPAGAGEQPRTFVVVRDGDVAHVRIVLDPSPDEHEVALSYHVPGLVRAGAAGAVVRADVPVPAGGVVDRLSASFGAGYGDERLLRSARALGAELDGFDGADAFLSLRGLGPGEPVAIEAALVPGAVEADGADAAPLVPDALPAWAATAPRVVDDDEEALPPAPAPAPAKTAAPAAIAAPSAVPPPPGGESTAFGRILGLGLVAAVVGAAVGAGRWRRRRDAVPAHPGVAPPAPPTASGRVAPVEPTAPTDRGP